MSDVSRDRNYVPGLIANSNDGLRTPVDLWADPTTHRLLTTSTISNTVTVTPASIVIDPNNTTEIPLLADEEFPGASTDISGYANLNVKIFGQPNIPINSDATDAMGTFLFEFSDDDTNWDTSVPALIRTLGIVIPIPLRNVGKYFRVRYLNDGGALAIAALGLLDTVGTPTDQTEFRLTTYLSPFALGELTRTLDQGISGSDPASLSRAVLMGRSPGGPYKNIGTKTNLDGSESILANIGADFTMFGALSTANLKSHLSVAFNSEHEMDTLTVSLASGGTETVTDNNLVISTGVGATNQAGRFSKARLLYAPGQEARTQFTTIYDTSTANVKQQHGLFSEDFSNSVHFEDDGTGFYVVHKRGGVEVSKIAEADWNGNLSTNYTENGVVIPFDPTINGRVYRLRFGYLGYLGIEYIVFSPDGEPVLMHRIKYQSGTPLFTDLNLYLMMKAVKTSGTADVTMKSASWMAGIFGEPVDPLVSSENSTTTALGIGDDFPGDWVAHGENNSLELVIATDQVSASNGIDIQFSDRGDSGAVVRSHRYDTYNENDVIIGSKSVVVEPRLSYSRIVYTNGGVAQGSLFMELRFHKQLLEIPRGELEATVNPANVSVMTRGVIMGKTDADEYVNNTMSDGGHFRISAKEQEVEWQNKACSTQAQNALTVTTTPAQIDTSQLADRKYITICNTDTNRSVFYGTGPGTTISNALELPPSTTHQQEWDDTLDIYVATSTSTASCRLSQSGGVVA